MADQKDNIVGGDLAGRDIIYQTIQRAEHIRKTPISALYEKFKEQKEEHLEGYIEELEDLMAVVSEGEVQGIVEKLTIADRADMVDEAKRHKEAFMKKLMRHQFSPSAQRIFTHLLANVLVKFQMRVTPKIKEQGSRSEVDGLLEKQVIEPVYESLEENILFILRNEIIGMVFFLTGTCRINWRI